MSNLLNYSVQKSLNTGIINNQIIPNRVVPNRIEQIVADQIRVVNLSQSNYNILQIIDRNYQVNIFQNYYPDISYTVLNKEYNIINNFFLNLTSIKQNSNYRITINFNYTTSSYVDTMLKVAIFYRITDSSIVSSNEVMIGEYTLGSENANFINQLFSNSFYQKINLPVNSNINFYLKAKIESSFNDQNTYDNLDNIYKPNIYFKRLINCFTIEEINNN